MWQEELIEAAQKALEILEDFDNVEEEGESAAPIKRLREAIAKAKEAITKGEQQ